MQPKIKVWVEKDGQLVLSDWRVLFLETIAETGSLSQAATRLGIPYRRLWGKIREIEAHLGVRLVVGRSGGQGGGGANLTPAAQDYIRRYRSFKESAEEAVAQRFTEVFGQQATPEAN